MEDRVLSLIPDLLELMDRVSKLEDHLSAKALKNKSKVNNMKSDHSGTTKIDPSEDLVTEVNEAVKISSKAYVKMVLHAKKYANSFLPKSEWVEVIGLLTGYIQNEDTPLERVIIDDAWAVGHGDAVSVSIIDSSSFLEVINELAKDHYIVGWYHSHPSYGRFLSVDDFNTQTRYQALWSKSLALVIDPNQISKTDQGFSVFRNGGPSNREYVTLSHSVEGLSSEASFEILKLVQPLYEGKKLEFLEYESPTYQG